MKIYRIENEQTMHGMWYRLDGTFDPFIERLTEGKSRDLPMDFESRFYDGGTKWFSGCGSIEMMQSWFSARDAFELAQNGYRLFQFESKQFLDEQVQVLFTREGVLKKEEIPLDAIWNVDKFVKERVEIP